MRLHHAVRYGRLGYNRLVKTWVWLALAAPAAAAVITGTVSEFRSGRVLARSRVTIESAPGSGSDVNRSAFADAAGAFQFANLPAGAYLLRAERRGFATARFGESAAAKSGTPVVVTADGGFTADIRMRKLGVITGEVQDENRVGLAEFEVGVYRAGSPPRFVASTYTDDRGVFRVSNLEPGTYYVRSEARELEGQQGLLPTYLGQALRASEARTVAVALDDEAAGLRIEPIPGRLSALGGTLSGPVPATVSLQTDAGLRTAQVAPGGSFRFPQLVPGTYDLMAQSTDAERAYSAYLRVEMSSGDRMVNVQLVPSPVVRLRCESRGGRDIESVSTFVRRREPLDDQLRRLSCGASLTLSPGRWEIGTMTPPSLYVASYGNARSGENSYEFSLGPGEERELTLALRSTPGAVSGKVLADGGGPAAGVPVCLYPLDAELRSRLGGIVRTRTTDSGDFRFGGLAPGRYELLSSFSLEEAHPMTWPVGQGKILSLEEGADVSVTVPLKDLP